MCEGMRMSSKGVIKDKIKRKELEIRALKVLLNSIIWDSLSKQEEEDLWHLLISDNRW